MVAEIWIYCQDHGGKVDRHGTGRFDGRLIIYESVGHQDEIGDPEEQVRADLYLDLVEKYGYNTLTQWRWRSITR